MTQTETLQVSSEQEMKKHHYEGSEAEQVVQRGCVVPIPGA